MLKDFKSLFKETAIYGLSTVVGRLLNILLLPLYTHCLTPADYGIVATAFAYIAFLTVLYSHGMDMAFMRFGVPKAPGQGTRDFATPFWSLAATSLALSLLIHAAAGPLSSAVDLKGYAGVIRCSAWILALDALALAPFAELRLTHRSYWFVGVKVSNIAVNLILNYVFLVRMGMGVAGVFYATLASSALTVLLLSPVILGKVEAVFDKALHRELLRFGLPLLPAGLAAMVIQVADRPILKAFTDNATVGIYQANHKLAVFMMMAVSMFDTAFRPFYLEKERSPDLKRLLSRVMTYFVLFASFVFLGISLFLRDIVALPLVEGKPLIHPDYWVGLPIVPVVMLGYLLNGIYFNLHAPVTLAKRTDYVAYATLAGAAVNIAANALLIPYWGMMGAAIALLLAYAVMSGILLRLGRRVLPVDYEFGRVAHIAVCAAVVTVFAVAFRVDLKPGFAGLVWKAAFLAMLPLGLAATGFFVRGQVQTSDTPSDGKPVRRTVASEPDV